MENQVLINGDNILDRNVFEYGVRDMYGCVYFSMHFNGATSGHLYSQYHWSSKNYGGCSTTTQSGWHSYWSDFFVDFGTEPQTVSQEFYEWFIANTTQTIENTFYIHTDSGRLEYQYEPGMTFADFINSPYNIDSLMYINDSGNININNALYGPFDYSAPNIVKPEYPIDKDAYYGLTMSGLKCDKYYLSGTWQLKDSLTLPSNTIQQSVTFTENILGTITSLTIYNNNNETYVEVNTESDDTYLVYTGTWENGSPIINFGTEPQTVSQEFYEWFTTNATQPNGHEIAGLYASGTNNLLYTWQELIDGGYIVVNNGVLTTPYDSSDAKNGAKNILTGDLYLPDDGTIKELGDDAFHLCSNLTAVYLPDGLTSIGWMAFAGTQIQNINLPQSITKVKASAFYGCNNLTTIYYNDYVMNMLSYVDFADDWNINMPEVNIVCLDATMSSNSMFAHGHIAGFHEFDPDMTWEEWINSDYNDGQYIVYNNEIYTYDLRYKLVDSSSGTTVKKSDKIKSMRRYTVIDMNPSGGHSAGSGN